VRLVRLWFTDVLGTLKSFAISPAELENALNDGMTFDGSSIDGYSRTEESDVLAIPDPNTFEVLPWVDSKSAEARVFCDIYNLDGTTFGGDPRQVLRRNLDAARADGYEFLLAPDIEYFYFAPPKPGEPLQPLDEGGFFDLTTTDVASSLRKETIRTLETMGIPVEYSFHEDAPSQQEIDLRHTDALSMADSVMTFRMIVKELAAMHNVHATFMPKPLEGVQGSGMHMHLSLFKGDNNAFYSADDENFLSADAKAFMAGLLRHAAEITAITNQTVNSYKRLVPGFEAPVHISWARNNRSGLIRVPIPKRGNPSATRLEYRSPDPACNPYLAFSVILAAGMKGIREGYELPAEAGANLFQMTDADLSKMGINQLPQSLSDALKIMESSELVAEALGEHIFDWFLRNKRHEWMGYKTQVTPYEINRYLKSL
jgi:glutamine synthetase